MVGHHVMELPGDSGPLAVSGSAGLRLLLGLHPLGPLLQVGHVLPPYPQVVPDQPGAGDQGHRRHQHLEPKRRGLVLHEDDGHHPGPGDDTGSDRPPPIAARRHRVEGDQRGEGGDAPDLPGGQGHEGGCAADGEHSPREAPSPGNGQNLGQQENLGTVHPMTAPGGSDEPHRQEHDGDGAVGNGRVTVQPRPRTPANSHRQTVAKDRSGDVTPQGDPRLIPEHDADPNGGPSQARPTVAAAGPNQSSG